MCFGNRKKINRSQNNSHIKDASNSARQHSGTRSAMKSLIKDSTRQLKKSTVHIRQIAEPQDFQLFPNCKTQKLQINAVSNQHKSYVRRQDYFKQSLDISIYNMEEPQLAQYQLADLGDVETPPINRFYYDKSGATINYI